MQWKEKKRYADRPETDPLGMHPDLQPVVGPGHQLEDGVGVERQRVVRGQRAVGPHPPREPAEAQTILLGIQSSSTGSIVSPVASHHQVRAQRASHAAVQVDSLSGLHHHLPDLSQEQTDPH